MELAIRPESVYAREKTHLGTRIPCTQGKKIAWVHGIRARKGENSRGCTDSGQLANL